MGLPPEHGGERRKRRSRSGVVLSASQQPPRRARRPTRERTAKQPRVYIIASQRQGTLYIGVTADLLARSDQHRDRADGFTGRD
ncbi:GIY-YIG nuclease family protein [Sphingomonas sp. BK580]|uniref:GIY-YIG nuclease family protein n=1 Tax=Sphingomonas sp. BK580 TaxID=2586972 RepID=UPI003905C5A5